MEEKTNKQASELLSWEPKNIIPIVYDVKSTLDSRLNGGIGISGGVGDGVWGVENMSKFD